MFYAGIGSRSTPEHILRQMTVLANNLEREGFILRSGGANGADSAFARGVVDNLHKNIYLPWKGFNDDTSILFPPTPEAYKLAAKYHPAWKYCSGAAKSFHARNSHQLFGYQLDCPVQFVLCWTPNGKTVGGIGQAIRIAQDCDIPVFNMGAENWKPLFDAWMNIYHQLLTARELQEYIDEGNCPDHCGECHCFEP